MIVQQQEFIKDILSLYSMEDYSIPSSFLPKDIQSLFKTKNLMQDSIIYLQIAENLNFRLHI